MTLHISALSGSAPLPAAVWALTVMVITLSASLLPFLPSLCSPFSLLPFISPSSPPSFALPPLLRSPSLSFPFCSLLTSPSLLSLPLLLFPPSSLPLPPSLLYLSSLLTNLFLAINVVPLFQRHRVSQRAGVAMIRQAPVFCHVTAVRQTCVLKERISVASQTTARS